MKKTLALVLSVMMVLSLFAGMFSFTASAAEKGYAETEADKLWAAADTVKATSLTLQIGSAKVDIDAAVTNAKIADLFKDIEFIAEDKKATQSMKLEGSFSFDGKGTLILKGAAANHTYKYDANPDFTINDLLIFANGGLKVVLEEDYTGTVRSLAYTKAKPEQVPMTLSDGTPVLNDDGTPKMKDVETIAPAKSHLLVTSENGSTWTMPANGIGWDAGAIVVYGNIILAGNADNRNADGTVKTGYDCMILRDNSGTYAAKGKGYPLILGNVYTNVYAGGNGGVLENRSGDFIICDDAVVVMESLTGYGLRQAAAGYNLYIRDNAFVSAKVTKAANWKGGIFANGLKMTGGTLLIDVTADPAATAVTGLDIQGNGTTAAELTGGKAHITVKAGEASTTNNRMYGIFLKNLAENAFTLDGAEVYVNVKNIAITAEDANNGIIHGQAGGTKWAIKSGKLTADADANTMIFNPTVANTVIDVTGGDIVVNSGKAVLRGAAASTLNVAATANLKLTADKGVAGGTNATVSGITLAADAAAAVTQGTAASVPATAPVVPAAPEKPNPPTSDFVVAPFVAVAAMAVVASAAIVLRKKVNG